MQVKIWIKWSGDASLQGKLPLIKAFQTIVLSASKRLKRCACEERVIQQCAAWIVSQKKGLFSYEDIEDSFEFARLELEKIEFVSQITKVLD